MVIAALVAGAFTAIVGMITQVRDPAVGLAPRLAAVGLALVLTAPVIAQQASAFATRALTLVGRVGG
jgi:flagellar biosynthesis protein FliQ